jgi:hypothetical protein
MHVDLAEVKARRRTVDESGREDDRKKYLELGVEGANLALDGANLVFELVLELGDVLFCGTTCFRDGFGSKV